jgi:anaerobic selenocysteine-containing dehydrogenase
VIPGFDDYEARAAGRRVHAAHGPRDGLTVPTPTGRARFTLNEFSIIEAPPGRLPLQTARSHDRYNTTIYGLDDPYRDVHGGRRVVLVHPDDPVELGLPNGSTVDIVSERPDGVPRRAVGFRIVSYPTAKGCAATDFPEANVPVPLDSTAEGSRAPTSKQIMVRLEPST